MKRKVWLLVVAILVVGVAPVYTADEGKKDIPLYDGKPGAKIGDVCINPKDNAEMVWVPAGDFIMGSKEEEVSAMLKKHPEWKQRRLEHETPQHKVYLDGYWAYKYEVTVPQYRKFCEATGKTIPTAPPWGWKNNHPIVNVTWEDASDYAKWAEASLPTEAQWEKAARGTDGRTYPWGDKWNASKCAHLRKSDILSVSYFEGEPTSCILRRGSGIPKPVGSYPSGASPYGCRDMAGNVAEWCDELFSADSYVKMPVRNPRKRSPTRHPEGRFVLYPDDVVMRGNSCLEDEPAFLRCAYRSSSRYRGFTTGFRCVVNPHTAGSVFVAPTQD